MPAAAFSASDDITTGVLCCPGPPRLPAVLKPDPAWTNSVDVDRFGRDYRIGYCQSEYCGSKSILSNFDSLQLALVTSARELCK